MSLNRHNMVRRNTITLLQTNTLEGGREEMVQWYDKLLHLIWRFQKVVLAQEPIRGNKIDRHKCQNILGYVLLALDVFCCLIDNLFEATKSPTVRGFFFI